MKERYKMFFLTGFLIIIVDQIIKLLVSIYISYGETIGNWIKITNIANTGFAYSMRTR